MAEKIRDVDKNDVDISQLFKWNKEVELEDVHSGMKVKFYMRLLGDADLGRARANAYRKSADLRKKLKTKDSNERISLLAELEDFTDPEILVKSIELLRISDIYQQAIKNVDVPEPKEPADDELEKWEEHQTKVDDYAERFKKAVEEEADKLRKADLALVEGKSIVELYKIYENEVINRLCQDEMNNGFYDMCIYFATFKDDKFKTQAFKNFESYENVHPSLKDMLKKEYRNLELGIDILKK
jgi:predicted DNA binding CopG/RHH family protein